MPSLPSDSTVVSVRVTPDEVGTRVDRVLAAHLGAHTRSRIQQLIREGLVRRGDRVMRPSHPVQAGDVITVEIPAPTAADPEPEALPLAILHDDPDLIVVDKPAGMVVHPAAGHAAGTLVNALLHHVRDLSGIGGRRRPGIVHRLDRGTSGVMVVAKHDRAHAALAAQFQDRTVEKRYVTLVWGMVQAGRRIDLPIGRDPRQRQKISTRSRRPRPAVTRVTRSEPLQGVSLLEVAIDTGRTHQIRVHLSAIGHPVVGDPTYGGRRRHPPPRLRAVQRLERPFLHAARLSFHHPGDGRPLTFETPLPTDLQIVLDRLRAAAGPRGADATFAGMDKEHP